MKLLPVPAQIFIVALIGTGAALMVALVELPRSDRLLEFLVLLLLAIVTSALKLPLPTTKSRTTMSASFVIDFTALLVFGPHSTMLIAIGGALSQSLLGGVRRNPAHRTLFNMACFVLTIEATGLVYHLFGGSPGHLQLSDAPPLIAAVVAYFLVNSGLIALVVGLSSRQPVARVWSENFLWSAPNYFIGAAVAAMAGVVMVHHLWSLLPLACIPVYLTHRAYRSYAGRLADEHRHREIIESLNEGMAVIDRQGVVTLWNDALERMIGCPRDKAIGRPLVGVVPALAKNALRDVIATGLQTGQAQVLSEFVLNREGTHRILHIRLFPYVDGMTLFWDDVTERADAERALKSSEERYALAAAGANDGLWDWDLGSGDIYFSSRWHTIVGSSGVAHTGRLEEWLSRVHRDDAASFEEALKAHIRGLTEQFHHEHRIRCDDGTLRWVLCRGAAVRNAKGRATRLAGSLTDITDRATVQEQLREAALHDSLTALPNRRMFTELLRQSLDRCREQLGRQCAVLFLDIDRFKVVNDSLGHAAGDELLVAVSERLRQCMRNGDVLARLGGDEFTILLSELSDVTQACAIAARLQSAIQAPLSIAGRDIFVSASIGIAINQRRAYERPEDIMRDADAAMYRAKTLGKARHEVFDEGMLSEAVDRLVFENDLRRAIERGELALHYQPIVSLSSGVWTGFESLLRWNRAGHPVSPSKFIPVAEETGFIRPLGTWVLNEACQQYAEWRLRYPYGVPESITVNVSARQLVEHDFLSLVERATRESGMRPGSLRLEITETSLMARPELVAHVLRDLRTIGVSIYLDDFGTGYSSLNHLHRLPVDALKIDRSFVQTLLGDDRPAIVESILALARTLGTQVIAEGVETSGQLHELRRLGCGLGQGYLFSKPLAPVDAEVWLAGWSRERAEHALSTVAANERSLLAGRKTRTVA